MVIACFQVLQSAVDRERELEREAAAKLDRESLSEVDRIDSDTAEALPNNGVDTETGDQKSTVTAFQQLNHDDGDKAWRRIQPQLVTLEIATPLGPRSATGLMIDPRGWVLTAYQTCRDASSIRVRATARTWQPMNNPDLLSDQVRGVLATDVPRNLVLLSVNPRFAPSNRVEIDPDDALVEGRFLFQCEPPSDQSPDPVTEVRVAGRGNTESLPDAQNSELRRLAMSDADVDWIVHRVNEATRSGTVLLNESGEVAGMHLLTLGDAGFAIPASEFNHLIDAASGDVQPIESLTPPESAAGLIILQPDHPLYKISLTLNQTGDACRQFRWLPETEGDAAKLKAFVDTFEAAKRVDDSHPGAETIERQQNYWINSVRRSLGDPSSAAAINAFAADSPSGNAGDKSLFAVVTYELIDIESDQLLLRVSDTDRYVRLVFDDSVQSMRPGEQWLLMARIPAGASLRRRSLPAGKTIEYQDVEMISQVGPLGHN